MSYKKNSGGVICKIISVTPLWIDVRIDNGDVLTFAFAKKPCVSLFEYLEWIHRVNKLVVIFGKKLPEDKMYLYSGSSLNMWPILSRRKLHVRLIKQQSAEQKFIGDLNPVRAKYSKTRFGAVHKPEYIARLDRHNTTMEAIARVQNDGVTPRLNLKCPRKLSADQKKTAKHEKLSKSGKKAWGKRREHELEIMEF